LSYLVLQGFLNSEAAWDRQLGILKKGIAEADARDVTPKKDNLKKEENSETGDLT
jgi:hypothetical protein